MHDTFSNHSAGCDACSGLHFKQHRPMISLLLSRSRSLYVTESSCVGCRKLRRMHERSLFPPLQPRPLPQFCLIWSYQHMIAAGTLRRTPHQCFSAAPTSTARHPVAINEYDTDGDRDALDRDQRRFCFTWTVITLKRRCRSDNVRTYADIDSALVKNHLHTGCMVGALQWSVRLSALGFPAILTRGKLHATDRGPQVDCH